MPQARGLARLRDRHRARAGGSGGERFDLAIDLHGGPRSAWLTWASGAPMRIGYAIKGRSWMYTTVVDRAPPTWRRGTRSRTSGTCCGRWASAPATRCATPWRCADDHGGGSARRAAGSRAAGVDADASRSSSSTSAPATRSAAGRRRRSRTWSPAWCERDGTGASWSDRGSVRRRRGAPASRAAARARLDSGRAPCPISGTSTSPSCAPSWRVPRCTLGATAGRCTSPPRPATPIVALLGPTLPERSRPWRDPRWFAEMVDVSLAVPAVPPAHVRARRLPVPDVDHAGARRSKPPSGRWRPRL